MADIEAIKSAANGKWDSIFNALGVPYNIVNGKNQPCPSCEGKDRYQYTNYNNDGMFNCRSCGAGDGFKLLTFVLEISLKTAFNIVSEYVGTARIDAPTINKSDKRIRFIKNSIMKLTGNDPASLYLKSRKIFSKAFSKNDVGFIRDQFYYKDGIKLGKYNVLVSALRDNFGELVTYQLIYLTDKGEKANVENCKKVISSFNGKSCGFYPFGFDKMNKEEQGITEGLEDAISVAITYKIPVVGVVGTSQVEVFNPSSKVKYLTSFIQNDKKFQGQFASFKMLKALADKTDLKLDWIMSEKADFNDDLNGVL